MKSVHGDDDYIPFLEKNPERKPVLLPLWLVLGTAFILFNYIDAFHLVFCMLFAQIIGFIWLRTVVWEDKLLTVFYKWKE